MAKQETREPTFTLEQLNAVVAQAVAEALAQREKNTRTVDMEALAIKAFRRAGYGEVKPRQDVKTYALWIADGFKVREGEKSVRVKSLRLFHRSQVEPISEAEKAAYLAQRAAKTADRLPAVSPLPVTPITAAPKAKKAKPVAAAQAQA
jgi:hypothetical protein